MYLGTATFIGANNHILNHVSKGQALKKKKYLSTLMLKETYSGTSKYDSFCIKNFHFTK